MDLVGRYILDRLKPHEIQFLNEITKYNLAPRYIVVSLEDRDRDNLMSITHIYKARSIYQTSKRGSFTKMQHFLKLIYDEKYMY